MQDKQTNIILSKNMNMELFTRAVICMTFDLTIDDYDCFIQQRQMDKLGLGINICHKKE
jgi:hypothetical protein